MSWFRPFRFCGALSAAGFLYLTVIAQSVIAGETTNGTSFDVRSNPAKNLARMNCGSTIEVICPDGRTVLVTY